MKLVRIAILVVLAASLIGSFVAYDMLPETVASHWNAAGEVDGYMDRGAGAFMMPVLSIFLVGLFYVIPRIDPLKRNILGFMEYYEGFILVFVLFLTYMNAITLAWNLGHSFNMGSAVTPAIGLLFIYIGFLCGASRQNWFIGIRTPWTLSSERVWAKTHSVAKNAFVLLGLLWIVFGFVLPGEILVLIAATLAVSLGLVAYSYFAYKKEREIRPPAYGKGEVPSGGGAFPFAGKVPPAEECTCEAMGGECLVHEVPMGKAAPAPKAKKAPRRAARPKKAGRVNPKGKAGAKKKRGKRK
jgi:uncharacterized membrane protein